MQFAAVAESLAGLSLLVIVLAAGLLALHLTGRGRALVSRSVTGQERLLLGLAWFIAATAMAGSLYFSEVVGFEPCLLCWYQRIAMYPLVLVLGVAALAGDARVWRYALPLAGVGLAISIYHYTIQNIPSLDVVTCSEAVPCTGRYLAVFGFVSIPFMAGAGFLGIGALLLAAARTGSDAEELAWSGRDGGGALAGSAGSGGEPSARAGA